MLAPGSRCVAALCFLLAWGSQAAAAGPPVRVVVSFSILTDIVARIGGAEVAVTSLVGPDSDAHVFEPNPDQARLLALAGADIIVAHMGLTTKGSIGAKTAKTLGFSVPQSILIAADELIE